MSEVAGGSLIVGGAAAAGAAVLVAGALTIGAGYLVCQGGYRAIKACKQAWDAHLKALEEERQRRLEELRKADEEQLERLRTNLAQWSSDSQQVLRGFEEKARRDSVKRATQIIEEERKKTETLAAWKRITLLDEELKASQDKSSLFPPSIFQELDKKEYHAHLEKSRNQLLERARQLEQSQITLEELVLISTITPLAPEEMPVDVSEFTKELAVCRGKLAGLLFLADDQKMTIIEKIKAIERDLDQSAAEDIIHLESAMRDLKHHLAECEVKDDKSRKLWQEAQDTYFSLHDRYTTANQDPVLKKVIEEPLADLAELLKTSKECLTNLQADPASCAADLRAGQENFQRQVDRKLKEHQQNINLGLKNVLGEVLDNLDYRLKKVEEKEGSVQIIGSGTEEHKGATITFSIDSEGYFSVDLSHKGFKNQSACTKEFYRIQSALRDHGIVVDLREHRKTWMTNMVHLIKKQLVNMGYPEDSITAEEVGEGTRMVAFQSSGDKTEIVIDAASGEFSKVEGAGATELKSTVQSVEEESEEELLIEDEVVSVEQ